MQRSIASFLSWLTLTLILALPIRALDVGGTIITGYQDYEGTTGLVAGTQHGQFKLIQAGLRLSHEFNDYNRFGASISSGQGAAISINEAWMEMAGLPYDGVLTVGRFYKPLAAPLQTLGLSYATMLYHANPSIGARIGMEYYPFRWEAGVVNSYDLSLLGSRISNSTAFGRPVPTPSSALDHHKEVYTFLGWRDGGEWGSLDLTGSFTYGEFSTRDKAVLASFGGGPNGGLPGRQRSDRYVGEFSADYTYGPYRAYGSYLRSREGNLALAIYNVNGSYRLGRYNFILGYDHLENNIDFRPTSTPATWQRDRVTYGINYELASNIQLALEYEDNREDITTTAADRRQIKDGIDNDGISFQMLASF